MVDGVFELSRFVARFEDLPFAVGIVGIENPVFCGKGLVRAKDEKSFGFGLVDKSTEGIVGFVEYFLVLIGRSANAVFKDFVRP